MVVRKCSAPDSFWASVEDFFGWTQEEFTSKRKQEPLATARAALTAYMYYGLSMDCISIGRILNRDRTNAYHHIQSHEDRMQYTLDQNGTRRFVDINYYDTYSALEAYMDPERQLKLAV